MINLTDKTCLPEINQIGDYIGNPLFWTMHEYLTQDRKALCELAYSGDSNLPGWNVSYRKSGRALCRLYPKRGYFAVLTVVGRKEKQRVEDFLPHASQQMRDIYLATAEGMGQRWLMIDLHTEDELYRDVLKLIDIRRESR